MAKSPTQQLDIEVSQELGLRLDQTTVLKRIVERKHCHGAFVFAYQQDGYTVLDIAELYSSVDGIRFKPERFILPTEIKKRLASRTYMRWYFSDLTTLTPFQPVKLDLFLDSFNFYQVDNPCIKHLICPIDADFIRKKPLQAALNLYHTPPQPTKTKRRSKKKQLA